MRIEKLLHAVLDLFDGGAGGETGGTQAAPSDAGRAETGGSQQKVVYGRQAGAAAPPDAGEEQGQATPEERRRAYRALVDGEFKDQYAEDVNHMIGQRFREEKNIQEQMQRRIEQSQPVIDLMMQRYGITDGDVGRLRAAIEGDDAMWADKAEAAGMSVEQYKQLQQLQARNAQLMAMERARVGREQAERQMLRWNAEAQEARLTYPGLDLNAEARDPRFLSMLKAGVPVKLAYEAVHHDELIAAATRNAARTTEKKVVDGIKAKGKRPAENGVSSQSGFVVKDDVSKLTNKDLEEISRRVMNGEKISFG